MQSFLVVVFVIESLLEGVALLVLHKLGLDWLPAGPFGITFAIMCVTLVTVELLAHAWLTQLISVIAATNLSCWSRRCSTSPSLDSLFRAESCCGFPRLR